MARGTHARRIARLEAILEPDARIPVYVADEQELAPRIDELIAAGALRETDRARCIFWLDVRPYPRWQRDDAATRRLQAQAAIPTPSATWLAGADRGPAATPAEPHATGERAGPS